MRFLVEFGFNNGSIEHGWGLGLATLDGLGWYLYSAQST